MRKTLILLALVASPSYAQTFTEVAGAFAQGPAGPDAIYGASLVDVNKDGYPDFYHRGRLYLQEAPFSFNDALEARFETEDGTTVFGGAMADPDGDGFPDLFVEDFDPASRYFKNRFGIRWDLANDESGIDMSQSQSQGAVWGDYDQDGDLDLFVGEEFGGNLLFENNGDGTFRNAGLTEIQNDRHSYGLAGGDYDRDGDLDIFIAACYSGDPSLSVNALFRNRGDGTFEDVAMEAGVADSLAGWATLWLDYDRDAWPDLFIANMPIYGPHARPGFNKLYRNLGDGTFEDVSDASGAAGLPDDWGFGASTADFDNDGWEDIWIANDFSPHRLLRNQGDGTFQDILPGLGLLPIGSTIAISAADLDGDGWVDVSMASGTTGNKVFRNDGGAGNFLTTRLAGSDGNRDAVGAQLTAYLGDVPLVRTVSAGDGMTSQNHDLSVHFGLGGATQVDSLIVEWPAGGITRLVALDANQHVYLSGAGLNAPPTAPVLSNPDSGASLDGEVAFSWTESADPENDPVEYTLAILSLDDRAASAESVTERLSGSQATIDLTPLPDGAYTWTVVATDGQWTRGATLSGSFTIGGPTAVEPARVLPALSVYPNPVRGEVHIQSQARRVVAVYDMLGRQVAEWMLGGGTDSFPVSDLAAGLYLVREPGAPGEGSTFLKVD